MDSRRQQKGEKNLRWLCFPAPQLSKGCGLYSARRIVSPLTVRLVTRSACKRLTILFALLAASVFWCWWSMIRMPLKSFAGPLPPLTAEQIRLRDELRAHVEKLAGDIGERNAGCWPRALR